MLLKTTRLRCAALLFDMDGTLLNSEIPTIRAYTAWAAKYGLDPHEVLKAGQGRRTADTLSAFSPDKTTLAADIDALMYRERTDVDGVVEIPGAIDFLRALPENRWAIVTSADRALALARLTAAGIAIPPVLVTAEDVQVGKPSPEGYRLAASRLGFNAHDCIVFEDAPAGLAAGIAAGARVVAVSSTLTEGKLGDVDHIDDYVRMTSTIDGGELVISVS
jgi:sugar-phosphatase